jgi:hypothetical protein
MGEFAVDDAQLTIYLLFTFLSIAASLAAYCLYHHAFRLGDPDYRDHISILGKLSLIGEERRPSRQM